MKGTLWILVYGLAALGFTAPACRAQHFTFSQISARLENRNVDCIAQDRSGYLRAETENGLFRYEGREFVRFGTPNGFDGRTRRSLFVSPDVAGSAAFLMEEIGFRIAPRWWQSRELRLALVLLLCLSVWVAWRLRVRVLIRQKRELEQTVRDRTRELEREKLELVRAREQMRHFAEHDGLTGVWNHRIVLERLRGEVDRSRREGTPLSVILVDLDRFKEVNDTHGHQCGDAVLKEVAAILLRSVRSYDWVGRYGGEEFLLILPGTSLSNARTRAEQLRTVIQAERFMNGTAAIQLTASLGVASGFPADHQDFINAAGSALYRAKSNGRNCVMATEIKPVGAEEI